MAVHLWSEDEDLEKNGGLNVHACKKATTF